MLINTIRHLFQLRTMIVSMLMLCSLSTASAQKAWTEWTESGILGIDYRVSYDYRNESAARKNRPAHNWCVQLRNRLSVPKGLTWRVGDPGQPKEKIRDQRTKFNLKAGTTETSCLHATNTPRTGGVIVYIDPSKS